MINVDDQAFNKSVIELAGDYDIEWEHQWYEFGVNFVWVEIISFPSLLLLLKLKEGELAIFNYIFFLKWLLWEASYNIS